jgi:nucleotide-binding universal stress UspA family protein
MSVGPKCKEDENLRVEGDRPQVSIDTVLFATDFSNCSENAGRYACLLARYYASKLIVTHAFRSSQAAMEAEALSHSLSREREENFLRLTRVAQSLTKEGVEAKPILLEGATERSIPELAEKHAPSLVVLGTHGGGRLQRSFIGSTADKILRSTPWPCFVVGPHVPPATNHAVPFRRILYATDFTPAAAHAAIYAISLAKEAGADIDVLNVVPRSAIEHPGHIAELEEGMYHELDCIVPQKAREFCNPRTFVDTGNAHKRIQEHIRDYQIDLLVIGVRKSSHLDIEMRASDAFRLVVESPCPVLTILG